MVAWCLISYRRIKRVIISCPYQQWWQEDVKYVKRFSRFPRLIVVTVTLLLKRQIFYSKITYYKLPACSKQVLWHTPRWTPDSDVFTVCTVVYAPRFVRALGDVSVRSTTTNLVQPYTSSGVPVFVVVVDHFSCTVTPARSLQATVDSFDNSTTHDAAEC